MIPFSRSLFRCCTFDRLRPSLFPSFFCFDMMYHSRRDDGLWAEPAWSMFNTKLKLKEPRYDTNRPFPGMNVNIGTNRLPVRSFSPQPYISVLSLVPYISQLGILDAPCVRPTESTERSFS